LYASGGVACVPTGNWKMGAAAIFVLDAQPSKKLHKNEQMYLTGLNFKLPPAADLSYNAGLGMIGHDTETK
jgi:hypothetical protein